MDKFSGCCCGKIEPILGVVVHSFDPKISLFVCLCLTLGVQDGDGDNFGRYLYVRCKDSVVC